MLVELELELLAAIKASPLAAYLKEVAAPTEPAVAFTTSAAIFGRGDY